MDRNARVRARRPLAAVVAVAFLAALAASPGRAVPPGQPGKIAFRSDKTGYPDIYLMNPDGSGVVDLTNQRNWNDQAAWSPDGKQIVFTSQRDDLAHMRGQIYVMNADGSSQHNLSNSADSDSVPDWSPDGTKIAFRRDTSTTKHIWTMNPDGSAQVDLTPHDSSDISPSWSPDGSKIAYSGTNRDIWVMNRDGSNPHNITNDGLGNYEPSWGGAAGDEIVFTSARDGLSELWMISATGSGLHRLTDFGSLEASWAPDGSKIVFTGAVGGSFANTDIFTINPDGSGQQDLTTSDLSKNYEASWQPVTRVSPPGSGSGSGGKASMCVVPRLRGLTLARARAVLTKSHCRLGKVRHRRKHHRHKRFVVTGQGVPPGRQLAARSVVSVVLS